MNGIHEFCCMHILLIAATSLELPDLFSDDPDIDMLITGVGCPVTVYQLHKRLQIIDYDLVIQVGIAGSFQPSIKPGTVVLVKQDCFADLGMESSGIFQTIFEAGFAPANEFPFSGGWLINQHPMLEKLPMEKVKAATINKVSDNELQKQQWISKYAAQIESMEGAALHYVCLQEKIPFLQIRSVSNWVGERDRTKWKMKEALENLGTELIKTIQFIRSSNS